MPGFAITIELHLDGAWRAAAQVQLDGARSGWRSPTRVTYLDDYVMDVDPDITGNVRGHAALGVGYPPSFERHSLPTWPPFLMDLLPQGHPRKVLGAQLNLDPDAPDVDTPLLLRAGGGPIGNMRVREAWEAECRRLEGAFTTGLTPENIYTRDAVFSEMAREFAAVAAGSSGVQGAWPKLLLTQSRNGLWFPDPMIPDDAAVDHAIMKWAGERGESAELILLAEAPYLELARAFGLRCGRPLRYSAGTLIIPRFDREVHGGRVIRLGQESIISAAGVAAFGHHAAHEDYLAVIKRYCTDPVADVTEYVLRDVLNLALGNPDNHGRNTALQKTPQGRIQLSPVFDFCPMRLDPAGVARATTWRCMRSEGGASRDLTPDWGTVCRVAAEGVMDPSDLIDALGRRADLLRSMPDRARALGIGDVVIERAMAFCDVQADALARLVRHGPR